MGIMCISKAAEGFRNVQSEVEMNNKYNKVNEKLLYTERPICLDYLK
jgi:hypothetical protein